MADYNWFFNDPLIGHRLIQLDMDDGKSCEKPVEAHTAFVKPYSLPPKKQIVNALKAIAEAEKVARFSDELPQIWVTPQWLEDMEKHSEHKKELERKQFSGMTQIKRTLPIRETLSLLDSMVRGGENHSELSKRKLAEARSILDQLEDPWFYTKDGELPGFNREVQLKIIDGENDFGWLVWHPSGNHYWETYDTHEIEEGREKDILDLFEVWCWQPIVKPQK